MSGTYAGPAKARPFAPLFPLSASVYFGWVAVVTLCGLGLTAWVRPTLTHSVSEWLGFEKPARAAPGSFYTVRVAPLLEDHCVGCHGAIRQKAKLRLDSFAALMRGGGHGPVVELADPKKSELLSRMTLPASSDKVMPPSGKAPLTADDITVIKLWIMAGASGVQPVGAIKGAPAPVVEVKFPDLDEAAVARQRATLAAVVKQLQTHYPGVIAYESRESADLQVNASMAGAAFGDTALAALAPLRDHIVWMDLSGTSVTDASAPAITAMRHLRVLRLTNIAVTDATVRALATLGSFKSLTVMGARVTDSSLGPLRNGGVKVYDGK